MIEERVGSALIEREGKYLLIKSKTGAAKGLWNNPGGRTFSEIETYEECAIRETREETGYDIKIGQLIATYHFQATSEKLVIKKVFMARIIGGDLNLPKDEIEDARWFSHEEIAPETRFTVGVIQSVKAFLNNTLGESYTTIRIP